MTSCTICVTAIEEDIAALPCRHVFHTECIKQWFSQKTSCPNCNKRFQRNSVIGPLYLEDPKALKATSATNNRNNETDQTELTLLRGQLAIFQRSTRELQQKVTYLKSIRSVDQLDSATQTPEAQGRIRHWQHLDNEHLATLVEVTSNKQRETERKLQKANTEFTTIQERLAQCQDEKKFFEKKFNKLRDKLQSVQKSKSSRSNHIARMYNEAGPSSSNVLGSNKGSSSRIYTTNAQADKSSNIHRSSSVDSDDSTSDELSVGPQTVPKKRARTGSSNRNHSGHGPYTTFSFNRSTTQTDQRKDTNGVPPRNQEPKEIKCPQSEIDDLELSDTNDYNENESSLVVLQSRVINGDSDSDTDDGGQASFDEGFSISTNRSRRHHHAQFRSPSPPVIEISDDDD